MVPKQRNLDFVYACEIYKLRKRRLKNEENEGYTKGIPPMQSSVVEGNVVLK